MDETKIPLYNPLRPLTREEITDEDLAFLNAARLGLIPISEWTRERNAQMSHATAQDLMKIVHWHEMDLDQKMVFVQKTAQIAIAVRMAYNREADLAIAKDNKEKSDRIKARHEKKAKLLVAEAEKKREEPKVKKQTARGLDPFQKAIKSLMEVNTGGKRIGLPDDAIVTTIKLSSPEIPEEKIRRTISYLRRECFTCGANGAILPNGNCVSCESAIEKERVKRETRPFQDEAAFADIDKKEREKRL
jgi:hypothetical protein